MLRLDDKCEILVDYNVCTRDEIELVADINGWNDKLIEDILYAREGYEDIESWCDDNNINWEEYERR